MSKNFYKNNHLYYFLILFFIFGLAFIRCKNHEPLTDIKSNINTIEKINHYPLVLTNKISSIQIPLIEYSKINYDQKKISVGCHFKSINTQIRIEGNSFCGSHYLSEESIYFFNNINSQQVNNYFYIKYKSNYSTIYYYKLNEIDCI